MKTMGSLPPPSDSGELCELLPARERGAEHGIRGRLGGYDRAAAPNERRRRAQRVERVPHGEGTTERRDDGEASAANRRERTTGLVHGRRPEHQCAPGVSLEKVAEQGGVPAQHDAVSVAGFAEGGVERGGAVAIYQGFGPREDDVCDGRKLECGALQQRGQVLGRPGENVDGALLEDALRAGEAGDGVDAAVARRGGRPFCPAPVVGADDEHGGAPPPGPAPAPRAPGAPPTPPPAP